eukprot:CAMPEP_0182943578 /NCGR_PEP_ID=MMETSP0105_2-20130417/52646_1 /TAXON_ID=81532 ORGANISM="Acanthoeca-like sp., Strain 10tr" /NCGR_SAMPLE_ID=MMETSP0105_2 /ASSEMBLY_ACC=CAM_ASM_000205 /LENGTH=49 /DNA_ID= /DNA_START= /DNA_END= /DNA_ORIENTATION=
MEREVVARVAVKNIGCNGGLCHGANRINHLLVPAFVAPVARPPHTHAVQ